MEINKWRKNKLHHGSGVNIFYTYAKVYNISFVLLLFRMVTYTSVTLSPLGIPVPLLLWLPSACLTMEKLLLCCRSDLVAASTKPQVDYVMYAVLDISFSQQATWIITKKMGECCLFRCSVIPLCLF